MPEGQQRVGALVEAAPLIRELGADPAEIAASVGLDLAALRDPENSIPFSAAVRLLQAAAVRTGCAHFGLLLGQRNDTRSLGLVGRLMRSAPTWGRAALDLVDNQHRYVRGGAPYLVARDGVAWFGYAIHQPGIEGVDQFCDAVAAVGFNMMRELCGALPDEVLLSRKPPADARPYRRFFRVPVRFDAEQWALVFPDGELERPCPAPIPASARSWRNRSRTIGRSRCPMSPTRSFEPCAPTSCSAKSPWRRRRAGSRCIRARSIGACKRRARRFANC